MDINKAFDSVFAYYQTGDLEQAENICKKILKEQPKHIDALHFLGVLCYQSRRYDFAIQYIRKALQFDPNFADAYNNLGNVYQEIRQLDEAIDCYRKALQINPALGKTYFNLGVALQDKRQIDEAISSYRKALQHNTHIFGLYNNLGLALYKKGQNDEAIACYLEALQQNPDFSDAYNNLGISYSQKGQFSDAIACYQKSLQLRPNFDDAFNNLGCVYKDRGLIDEAESWFRRAILANPEYSSAYSNLILTMQYNARHDTQTIYHEHLIFSKKHEEPLSLSLLPHKNDRSPFRKLKIGYLSPDFRRHAVTYFTESILISHNRKEFEVFCYSNSLKHDEITNRIQKYAVQWHEIEGMSDGEVSELIRQHEIDILVDLAGHTSNNRVLVFARKPAPIQVSWIGYLATTGLSAMDYKIVDNYTDPQGETEQFHTERLIRLPETFLCYLPDRNSPDAGSLPALSTGHITFGSFNNFSKVTPNVFTVWANILEKLPKSCLILKGKSFHDHATCQYVVSMFKQRGIAAERIILQSWTPAPKHLESYHQVDIGLDTFPFNGGATTCEAIWMGVPVITRAGIAYAARIGVSLLSNAGLGDLIAKTDEEYVELAVRLATDMEKLQLLRASLRDKILHSPLTDQKRFALNLERQYRRMWEAWCSSD
jgi:protein O-GlcNAc transferase